MKPAQETALVAELAELGRLVADSNVSPVAIGMRIRNTWPLYERAFLQSDGGGNAAGVPAQMQGSNDCGLAHDDVKPEDTTQGDRPARPVTCPPSDTRSSAGTEYDHGFRAGVAHERDAAERGSVAQAAPEPANLLELIANAYNDGFCEGMREINSSRGGTPWSERKPKYSAMLTARLTASPVPSTTFDTAAIDVGSYIDEHGDDGR